MNNINTIFFDLNGVLIIDRPGVQISPDPFKLFKRTAVTSDDRGVIDLVKKEAGWSEEDLWNYVDSTWKEAIANKELINFIITLKAKGYKTGIISNTSGLLMRRHLEEEFDHKLNELFDDVVISSEVGLVKPMPAIFQLALDRIESTANKSLFIDDALEYLDGAKLLGMKTILHASNLETIKKVSEILKL